LHNIVLALALGDVAHKKTAVWYGGVDLQFFAWTDLVPIQLLTQAMYQSARTSQAFQQVQQMKQQKTKEMTMPS